MCRLALLDLCDGRGRDQRSEDQYGEASLHRSLSLIELLLTSSLMSVCILVLRMRAVNQPHVPPARSQRQPHGTKTLGQLRFFRLTQQQATECLRPGTSVWRRRLQSISSQACPRTDDTLRGQARHGVASLLPTRQAEHETRQRHFVHIEVIAPDP